jgi:hypothetical protein
MAELIETVKVYKIFVNKLCAEGPHRKSNYEVDNGSINIRKIVGGDIDSRKLSHSRVQWKAYMVAVINLPFL